MGVRNQNYETRKCLKELKLFRYEVMLYIVEIVILSKLSSVWVKYFMSKEWSLIIAMSHAIPDKPRTQVNPL